MAIPTPSRLILRRNELSDHTSIVDHSHVQQGGYPPPEKLLEMVKPSVGKSGANVEYVLNTVRQMASRCVRLRLQRRCARGTGVADRSATISWRSASLREGPPLC